MQYRHTRKNFFPLIVRLLYSIPLWWVAIAYSSWPAAMIGVVLVAAALVGHFTQKGCGYNASSCQR
jgi:general stress protein CsbA